MRDFIPLSVLCFYNAFTFVNAFFLAKIYSSDFLSSFINAHATLKSTQHHFVNLNTQRQRILMTAAANLTRQIY